jgi:hypothetical protein
MQQNNGAGMTSIGCALCDEGDASVALSFSFNDLYFAITVFGVLT